jgi:hypothetical protein
MPPQRLKARSREDVYRTAEALRHPKALPLESFSTETPRHSKARTKRSFSAVYLGLLLRLAWGG